MMKVDFKTEKLEQSQFLELARLLIQDYPIYGSEGQERAQNKIKKMMEKCHFDQVYVDCFYAHDIKNNPDYVDVSSFGALFSGYEQLPRTNVIGVVDSHKPGPTLIFNGHIDVDMVYDEELWSTNQGWLNPTRKGDLIYGRGTTDMLFGLLGQIRVASWLADNKDKWCGKVIVCSVVDEEIGGNGTVRSLEFLNQFGLLHEGHTECLIAEPTNGKICNQSLGFAHFRVEAQKRPMHMGVAQPYNNSLWEILPFIDGFENEVLGSLFPNAQEIRLNYGVINGGIDPAVPIGLCTLEGTLFYPPYTTIENIREKISHHVEKKFPKVNFSFGDFNFPGASFRRSRLFECLSAQNIQKGEERGCLHSLFPSPCDARIFKKEKIPTTIFGPGDLKQAHSVDEFIDLNDWVDWMELTLAASRLYLSGD